jgi:quinohemoprotein amine dehydrogenase beta subunit
MRLTFLLAVIMSMSVGSCQSTPRHAAKRDYLVVASKPGRLFVIDAAARRVQSQFTIPNAGGYVGTIVPSPDGRIAYVLVNHMESIAGIDLASGQQVFRADLSTSNERVKCFMAFDVTPDGRELIVYELPTRLERAEYVALVPRFAVYSTAGGINAQPLRQFPAPRRVIMILARPHGNSFYAVGFDLFEFDRLSGHEVSRQGIRNWGLPAHASPDVLAVWPVSEPTGVFTTPVYDDMMVTKNGPIVAETSLMTLDLNAGVLEYHDIEKTSAFVTATVLAPGRGTAFGVGTQLSRIDMRVHQLDKRIDLDHGFYSINIATDGSEVYLGGGMCDIDFYDPTSLGKRAELKLPGCGDQSLSSLRVIRR